MSDLKVSANFLDLPADQSHHDRAAAHVIPVAFDGTSSWHKGADLGPQAIINASAVVEWYDIETATTPAEHGVWTAPLISGGTDGVEGVVRRVRTAVGDALDKGRLPVVLGGEHSVSAGAILAAADATTPDRLAVLQIDAHADTRESYHDSRWSHACVMARAREVADIAQVGIRSVSGEEMHTLDTSRVVWSHEIAEAERSGGAASGRERWFGRVLDLLGGDGHERRPVYITIDLDAFDPAFMPATGTPEPGGLDWWQVTGLIARVCESHRIVGFDLVELCPRPGEHASAFFAARLAYRVLAMALQSRDPAET